MKMANFACNILKASLFSLCLVATSHVYASEKEVFGQDKSVYAQLSSYTTQIPGTNPTLVVMEHVDGVAGLKIKNHEKIVVKQSGVYFILVNGQIGTSGVSVPGSVFLHLLKNNESVTSSCASYPVQVKNAINNIALHAVIALKEGDDISLKVFSSLPLIGLAAFENKGILLPSITFSMFQIGSK